MKCDEINIVQTGKSVYISMRTEDVTAARQAYDTYRKREIDVQIKPYRKRRSLDANAYAWVLISRIAEVTRQPVVEIYRHAVRDIGGNIDIVCVVDRAVERLREVWERRGIGWQTDTMPSRLQGCTNVALYYGSSVYDTHQMSLLIDRLIAECKDLGIETLSPDELERMMEEYEKQANKSTCNPAGG